VQAGPFGARHREVRSLFSSARDELGGADRANTPRIPSARGRLAARAGPSFPPAHNNVDPARR